MELLTLIPLTNIIPTISPISSGIFPITLYNNGINKEAGIILIIIIVFFMLSVIEVKKITIKTTHAKNTKNNVENIQK